MPKYRIAQNPYNIQISPWRGAVGIEELDDSLEDLAVPPVVAWFTRNQEDIAALVVKLLNEHYGMIS